jgi:signal transduction histidine kinase
MKFSKNPFTLFYIVFAYIVTFSIWWAYLLYNKNETAFNEKIEINKIYFNSKQHAEEYINTSEFSDLKQKYERQRSMIIMEGTVFILLLIGGLMIVKRVLTKELRLADLQRNFMLSITHELKSPLAAIKLNMQTVKGRDLEKEKSNKLIENSLSDVNRLETLIENILFASKLESDQNLHNKEELNLTETLHILIERFNKNAKKITIESQLEQDIYYHIDPIGFVSIVTNLIDNALKYSDQNKVIKILLEKAENTVV